jgi:RNA polymerase sigma factor (TIGR02999 family)
LKARAVRGVVIVNELAEPADGQQPGVAGELARRGSTASGVPKKFGAFWPGRWYTRRSSRGSEKGQVSLMSEVTRMLGAIEAGDPSAAGQLLPLVYEELRKLAAAKLAQEGPGQTLQATALVHEAYLRLVGTDPEAHWEGRGHFFAAAAEAMRRILVDNARRKRTHKHGGGRRRVRLGELPAAQRSPDDLLALDDALTRLGAEDPAAADLAKLHFYAGLSVEEAADALGVSRAQGYRQWSYARAWLRCALEEPDVS